MSIRAGLYASVTLLSTFLVLYALYAILTDQVFLLDVGWLLTTINPYHWAATGMTVLLFRPEVYFLNFDFFLYFRTFNLNTDIFTGIGLAMGLSVTGAAWGIWSTGTSVMGGGVLTPRIYSKNLVSIIFCEAVAIYGIIVSIIMATSLSSYDPDAPPAVLAKDTMAGYKIFGAGLITG